MSEEELFYCRGCKQTFPIKRLPYETVCVCGHRNRGEKPAIKLKMGMDGWGYVPEKWDPNFHIHILYLLYYEGQEKKRTYSWKHYQERVINALKVEGPLTLKQLQEKIPGLSKNTVRNLVKKGKVKRIKGTLKYQLP